MTVVYGEAGQGAHRFRPAGGGGAALAALIETVREGEELLIVNVAVRPAFQAAGTAVRLLRLAEELAARAGPAGHAALHQRAFRREHRLSTNGSGYAIEREEALERATIVHMVRPLA
jgi:GNAT superfamily N-acetyltransferase